LVIGAAVINALNPCTLGVLVFLLTTILGKKGGRKDMVLLSSMFILGLLIVTLLGGFFLLFLLARAPLLVVEYVSIVAGCILIVAGMIQIKEYFWYGSSSLLHLLPGHATHIQTLVKIRNIRNMLLLGAIFGCLELLCAGAPYLAMILVLSWNCAPQSYFLVLLYTIIFVSPLIVLLGLVAKGATIIHVKRWIQANRASMRLALGFLLICLGWIVILLANGTVNFG
jgi:hypothetical protein